MKGKRLWQTLRLFTILKSSKRTEYMKKHEIYNAIGDNCNIQSRKIPLYAQLIRIGNNVRIASGVTFITHDVTHSMLNTHPAYSSNNFREKVGCIEIKDNVFVGAGSTILYDVSIGPDVIVGAGSLVNKDIPPNSVVAGTPAKVIGTLDDYVKKRIKMHTYPQEIAPNNERASDELVNWCWEEFNRNHKSME